MTELIKNKTLDDIGRLRKGFEELIRTGETEIGDLLGDSLSLQGVHALKSRHNCALMAWQALDKILKDEKGYQSALVRGRRILNEEMRSQFNFITPTQE